MKGIYIVGGYPTREDFKERFRDVHKGGYDFIEVGIPFNDPTADGPVITDAAYEALEGGITTDQILDDMIELKDIPVKKYVMTYGNIIYSYGIEKFSRRCEGVLDGVIIADVPNRMTKLFQDNSLTIPIIPFVTLETRDSDMETINRSDADFIYFVGLRGTTGSRADFNSPEIVEKIQFIRERSDKKIVIGFGIKSRSDAKEALSLGDGFVIGTEAVRRQKDPAEFQAYLKEVLPR